MTNITLLQFRIIKVRTSYTFPVGRRDFDWVRRLGCRYFGYTNEVIKLRKFQLFLDNFHFFAFLWVVISLLKLDAGPPHSSSLLFPSKVASRMGVVCVS